MVGGSGWGLHFYSQKEWGDGKVVLAVMTTSPCVDGRNTTWMDTQPATLRQLTAQWSVLSALSVPARSDQDWSLGPELTKLLPAALLADFSEVLCLLAP